MSGGFNDPIIGGGGSLVYPAIHSPNFVTGSTGWSINKDGTAEFNSLTIRNGTIISGVFLLYSSAIPAKGKLVVAFAPVAGGTDPFGNVYPQGFNFGVWSASTGAIQQHFGIDNNGKLYLADSTGTTRIFADPSLSSLLVYDTTGLAAGHLIVSTASADGTDPVGNAFRQGLVSYANDAPGSFIQHNLGLLVFGNTTFPDEAHGAGAMNLQPGGTLLIEAGTAGGSLQLGQDGSVQIAQFAELPSQSSNPGQVPGSVVLWADTSGYPRVRSGASGDSIAYELGQNVFFTTGGGQTITPTAVTDITGLSQGVSAGAYYFRGIFRIKQGATNVNQNIGFNGPAVSNCVWFYSNGGQGSTMTSQKVVVGSLSLQAMAFPAAADEQYVEFEGTVTFSASGTFKCQAQAPTAGDNFTVQAGSIFIVRPVQ